MKCYLDMEVGVTVHPYTDGLPFWIGVLLFRPFEEISSSKGATFPGSLTRKIYAKRRFFFRLFDNGLRKVMYFSPIRIDDVYAKESVWKCEQK